MLSIQEIYLIPQRHVDMSDFILLEFD